MLGDRDAATVNPDDLYARLHDQLEINASQTVRLRLAERRERTAFVTRLIGAGMPVAVFVVLAALWLSGLVPPRAEGVFELVPALGVIVVFLVWNQIGEGLRHWANTRDSATILELQHEAAADARAFLER